MTLYLQLFWSFFQIGLFSFGGGYSALPLIESQVVDIHGWLTITEFADLVTIAGMTTGPIALNASTFVGIQIAGFWGAVVATLGCISPSCIIVYAMGLFYRKYKNLKTVQGVLDGLRPAVVALIASAGASMLILALWGEAGFSLDISAIKPMSVVFLAAGWVALRKWKPNPILVILGSGALGVAMYFLAPGLA